MLLRALGSPFRRGSSKVYSKPFSINLYKLARANKVALTYLSECSSHRRAKELYAYHYSRFKSLMNVLHNVSSTLEAHGFRYAVFKTVMPFEEDVADIDIICLSSAPSEYGELIGVLKDLDLVVMERGLYCTTFMDPRYRYATELMVDVYREVSVGPLVYIDKRLLRDRVIERNINGQSVRILNPVAELLTIIAHALIKEMEVKLLDHLATLYLVHAMDGESVADFIGLIRRARLVYGARLFLSIAAYLHKIAYGFIPSKMVELLGMLDGMVDVKNITMSNDPPYRLSFNQLLRLYSEKLCDPMFRISVVKGLKWFLSRKSGARLAHALMHPLG